jgi:type IV pilus assembly protein PilA
MQKNKGFSLIELLIVVAIILIIAAIAIPNLLRSRMAANEASATASLRTLNTAEITYASTYNSGFSSTLNQLSTPTPAGTQPSFSAADLTDPILSGVQSGATNSFTKNGFLFAYVGGGTYPTIANYTINADPVSRGSSGQRSFYTDQHAVVTANSTAQASSNDTPI